MAENTGAIRMAMGANLEKIALLKWWVGLAHDDRRFRRGRSGEDADDDRGAAPHQQSRCWSRVDSCINRCMQRLT